MDEPIRVLQCVTIMNRNGLENRLMDIYRNIDRSVIQFDFMTNRTEDGEFDEEIKRLGGRVYHMSRIAPKSFFRYIGELRTFFQEHPEYKIVHSHLNTLSTWPLLMAKRAGVPVRIAHSRNASMDRNFKMVYKAFSRLFINGQATDRFACSKAAGIWLFGKQQVEKESFHVIPNAIQLERFLYSEEKRHEMRTAFHPRKTTPTCFRSFRKFRIEDRRANCIWWVRENWNRIFAGRLPGLDFRNM